MSGCIRAAYLDLFRLRLATHIASLNLELERKDDETGGVGIQGYCAYWISVSHEALRPLQTVLREPRDGSTGVNLLLFLGQRRE